MHLILLSAPVNFATSSEIIVPSLLFSLAHLEDGCGQDQTITSSKCKGALGNC
jgi:hypothetical protein